ncbi:hypothetical protein BGZ51_003482 [Haplosporangium sp. Z 767]|nr:hypothetical protein BGZ51_003482 [Haplosporangium sp. Z 767]
MDMITASVKFKSRTKRIVMTALKVKLEDKVKVKAKDVVHNGVFLLHLQLPTMLILPVLPQIQLQIWQTEGRVKTILEMHNAHRRPQQRIGDARDGHVIMAVVINIRISLGTMPENCSCLNILHLAMRGSVV